MSNIEFVITIRCKICGDITSISVMLQYEEAVSAIEKFKEDHKHLTPWIV